MDMTEFQPRFMATTLPTVPHRDPVEACRAILESESEEGLLKRLEEGLELLAGRGIDRQKLLERSFVTPCCTTATLTPEQAERVFQYTKNISHRLRQKYFGETAGF